MYRKTLLNEVVNGGACGCCGVPVCRQKWCDSCASTVCDMCMDETGGCCFTCLSDFPAPRSFQSTTSTSASILPIVDIVYQRSDSDHSFDADGTLDELVEQPCHSDDPSTDASGHVDFSECGCCGISAWRPKQCDSCASKVCGTCMAKTGGCCFTCFSDFLVPRIPLGFPVPMVEIAATDSATSSCSISESITEEILVNSPHKPISRIDGSAMGFQIAADDAPISLNDVIAINRAGLPSLGSSTHSLGRCKPCVFENRRQNFGMAPCSKGSFCEFCHVTHDHSIRKKQRQAERAARTQRKQICAPESLLPTCV